MGAVKAAVLQPTAPVIAALVSVALGQERISVYKVQRGGGRTGGRPGDFSRLINEPEGSSHVHALLDKVNAGRELAAETSAPPSSPGLPTPCGASRELSELCLAARPAGPRPAE